MEATYSLENLNSKIVAVYFEAYRSFQTASRERINNCTTEQQTSAEKLVFGSAVISESSSPDRIQMFVDPRIPIPRKTEIVYISNRYGVHRICR